MLCRDTIRRTADLVPAHDTRALGWGPAGTNKRAIPALRSLVRVCVNAVYVVGACRWHVIVPRHLALVAIYRLFLTPHVVPVHFQLQALCWQACPEKRPGPRGPHSKDFIGNVLSSLCGANVSSQRLQN